MWKPRRATVAFLAAAAFYLFWIEYLPPFKRVRLYSDIEGFHWPLLVSAFEAIRHGRFPLWDASIYCGIPFAGNIQAGLFYPPTWLLFAVNVRSGHLQFKTLEAWIFLHAWLAFFLCYLWVRRRSFSALASVLGSSVFAMGGYMVSQNNHVGVVAGYAWTPLAWLGVEEALESETWRPMWKVAAASALCFLAGYTPSFVVFAIATIVYAAVRSWKIGIATTLAIAASLALAAVQLLPAMEAAGLKSYDPKYGPGGIRDPLFYLQLAIPDWIGFRFGDPYQYLYLGVPALFGLPWIVKRPDRAALWVLGVCALFMINPFNLVSMLFSHSALLEQAFPRFNFFEPVTLAFALIAATGVDAFRGWTMSRWFGYATAALLVVWPLYRLWVWPNAVTGWRSAAVTWVMLALFTAGLAAIRHRQAWVAVFLCAAVFVDYKVSGTSRVFSSMPGDVEPYYPRGRMPGVENATFDRLRANRHYRLALLDGVFSTDLRRYGLATPQGFDPLLSEQFKKFIEARKPFRTNRQFDLGPSDEGLLQSLGVRYLLTRDTLPLNGNFRLVGSREAVIKVYEYTKASPAYALSAQGEVAPTRWEPELREFRVNVVAPAVLLLEEQFYPGWKASIDGGPVAIERASGVFQSIRVPEGTHFVRFEYRPVSVWIGAAISAVSLLALALWLWRTGARIPT